MKIIGKAQGGFIVEMSAEEIAQIAGDGYAHNMETRPEVGMELKVGEKWKRLNDLDTKAKGAATSIPESLRMMAGLIEMAGTSLLPVADEEFEEVEK